jgi:hypothetical protein
MDLYSLRHWTFDIPCSTFALKKSATLGAPFSTEGGTCLHSITAGRLEPSCLLTEVTTEEVLRHTPLKRSVPAEAKRRQVYQFLTQQ